AGKASALMTALVSKRISVSISASRPLSSHRLPASRRKTATSTPPSHPRERASRTTPRARVAPRRLRRAPRESGRLPDQQRLASPCSSRRLGFSRRRDLAQLGAERVLRAPEIILGLDAHPERRRRAEISGEPQRGVGGHRSLLVGQPLDPGAWHAQRGGKVHRAKEFLAQDLAGMNRGEFSGHGGMLSRIPRPAVFATGPSP